PIDEARKLYAQASGSGYLQIAGVSVHIGSQITDVDPFAAAMKRVAELVRALRRDGDRIEYVDAGGGLGIAYAQSENRDFESFAGDYAEAVVRPLRGLKVHLLLEPGRSIVGPAGALLTSVLYKKKNDGKKFLVVDAAMNDLLRPSLYNAYHEIIPTTTDSHSTTGRENVDVVGPVCETGDFMTRDRESPIVNEGDLLALLAAGG